MRKCDVVHSMASLAAAPVLLRRRHCIHDGCEVVVTKSNEGRAFVILCVNNLVIRLHLVEARNWSATLYHQFKGVTLSVFMQAVQAACKTTNLVVGTQGSAYLLSTVKLPIADESEEVRRVAAWSCSSLEKALEVNHRLRVRDAHSYRAPGDVIHGEQRLTGDDPNPCNIGRRSRHNHMKKSW